MKGCFLLIDEDMKKTPEMMERRDRSGCTAICVMVTPTSIVCSNAGDSRACYCTNGNAVELSRDHKPYLTEEQQRIERAGGECEELALEASRMARGALSAHARISQCCR